MHDCYVMLTCREKISVADLQKKKEKEIKRKERAQIPEVTQNPPI